VGHVACMEETRIAYKILVGKLEGKGPLWRNKFSWEDNIRLDFTEIGWKVVDWINLTQDKGQW
jgi:hypothetical protein